MHIIFITAQESISDIQENLKQRECHFQSDQESTLLKALFPVLYAPSFLIQTTDGV
jgi:hypothetical protein